MKILGKLLVISALSSFTLFSNLNAADDIKKTTDKKVVKQKNTTKKLKSQNNEYIHEKNHNHEYNHHKMNYIIGGNFSAGISPNKDFGFDTREIMKEIHHHNRDLNNYDLHHVFFDQKMDYGYGGYVGVGQMLNSKSEIGIELGYNKFKNTNNKHDNNHSGHHNDHIKSNIFYGMINFTQYFDDIFDCRIRPYASVGAGLARISAEGHTSFSPYSRHHHHDNSDISDNESRNHKPKSVNIHFSDLEKVTFAYQFGLGFEAAASKNLNIGLGYKYFATHAIKTHDDDLKFDVRLNSKHGDHHKSHNIKNVNFGSLKHQNHMVNVFIKFHI